MTMIDDLRTFDYRQFAAITPSDREQLLIDMRARFGIAKPGEMYNSPRQVLVRRKRARERQAAHSRTLEGLFPAARSQAKSRGLEWALTFEEYATLRTGAHCHYCQGPLNETGSGLDRLNPEIGYLIGNVVPCCWLCNAVKGTAFGPEDMRHIGKTIEAIKRGRSPVRKPRKPFQHQPRQPSLF